MTLSLSDMASRVQLSGPKEAEKYVLHMIEDGEIFASINQKDGMVRFHDNPETYNSVEMLTKLDEEVRTEGIASNVWLFEYIRFVIVHVFNVVYWNALL